MYINLRGSSAGERYDISEQIYNSDIFHTEEK